MTRQIRNATSRAKRHPLLALLALLVVTGAAALAAVVLVGSASAASPATPTILSGPPSSTYSTSATFAYAEAVGTNFTMGPQAMEGALKASTGEWVAAGWHFKYGSSTHPASTVWWQGTRFTFAISCLDKTTPTSSTWTLPAGDQSYSVAAGNTSQTPWSSQQTASSYQTAAQLPALCPATSVAGATTTAGSTNVTVPSGGFPGVAAGMIVSAPGIPVGATVVSISGNTLKLSTAATAAGVVTLTFSKPDNISLAKGATFSSLVSSTDSTDAVGVQWHYVDPAAEGKGNLNCSDPLQNPGTGLTACSGGLSSTTNVTPGVAAASVTFACNLDNTGFVPCGSGAAGTITYPGPLARGSHAFQVQATAGGQTSAAASYSWTILAKATPTLTVHAPSTLPAGASIAAADLTATLSGSSGGSDTGTITFAVFGPQASPPATCAGGTVVGTAASHGDGAYPSSGGFTPDSAGTYWWYASSSGGVDDNPVASACGTASMTKTVVAPPSQSLTITGDAIAPVYPGAAAVPIAVTFANANSVPVDVTGLTVALDTAHFPAGCVASDFVVVQSNLSAANRLTVPAGGAATIPSTGLVSRPTVRMKDDGDQTACAGATIHFLYTSS